MKIILKNKSDVPIYEQIETQLIEQILSGALAEQAQMPSIRQLARDLKISVVTTTRVYNDLCEQGYLVSVAGKGVFVAPKSNDLLRERMLCEMEDGLIRAAEHGRNAGLTDEALLETFRRILEGQYGQDT